MTCQFRSPWLRSKPKKAALLLFLELLHITIKFSHPGGRQAIVTENLLLKHQLAAHSRSQKRAPKLSALDRARFGFWPDFLSRRRLSRAAILIKPSTLLKFHAALVTKKYQQLYSSSHRTKPVPKSPSQEIINAVTTTKKLNPRYGYPRIAQQINLAFRPNLN